MNFRRRALSAALILSTALVACGGATSGSTLPGTTPTASASTVPSASTALPLGDLHYTTTPRVGYVTLCNTPNGSPVVSSAPWLDTAAGTWNATQKIAVQGAVIWNGSYSAVVAGTTRTVTSNGLPPSSAPTGIFPIAASDPAYQYDRNPNTIAAQTLRLVIPETPTFASSPTCLTGGPIGITVTGVAIFDGFDAAGYDAVAHEVQDACHGHPDQSSTYHYHGWLQACVPDSGSATQNSSLLGYAADGFGIYGPWYNGKILTTADLDACHGTTSIVMWDGSLVSIYHYVSTYDFPYTLGCYRGSPAGVFSGPANLVGRP